MAVTSPPTGVTLNAVVAWGVLFLLFVAMTDIPMTQQVAAAFAWLLLVSVLLKYGPDAFTTITTINKTPASQTGKPLRPGQPA